MLSNSRECYAQNFPGNPYFNLTYFFAGSLNDKYERINRMGSQLDRIEQKLDLLLQDELKIERSIDKVKANTKSTYKNAKDGVSEGFEKARDGISKGLDWLSDNIKSPSQ